MKFGHRYWRLVAMKRMDRRVGTQDGVPVMLVEMALVQRCDDCGKFRMVRLDGDWEDYADGFYDEPKRRDG